MTQNSAARLIMRQRRRDHITPILIALHWLPIRLRVMYKLLVLTFLAIHNLAPAYITDLISIYEPGRQLRSASRALLAVPHHNLERFGRRGFSVNAPRLWNDLLDNLRVIDSVILFKRHLNPRTAGPGILRAPPLQNLALPRATPGMIREYRLLRFGALAIDDVTKQSSAPSNGTCMDESKTIMAA